MSVPIGLENLGNTCYANSIIQALGACSSFTSATTEAANLHRLFHSNNHSDRSCIVCILQTYFIHFNENQSLYWVDSETQMKHKTVLSPSSLIRLFPSMISSYFILGIQQDAHELLKLLLSSVESSFIRPDSEMKSKHSNPFSGLFNGSFENTIQCSVCKSVSKKVDPYEGIDIGIIKSSSLSCALDEFFCEEIMKGEDAYACEKCQTKTTARRYIRLQQNNLPKILTIQFKRFTPYMTKLQHHVQFSSIIDLWNYSCYTSSTLQQSNGAEYAMPLVGNIFYELSAVVVHLGSTMNSGHYIAYVRRDTRWFRADDSRITECSLEEVYKQQAYLLFYERTSDVSTPLYNSSFGLSPVKQYHKIHQLSPEAQSTNTKPSAISNKQYNKALFTLSSKSGSKSLHLPRHYERSNSRGDQIQGKLTYSAISAERKRTVNEQGTPPLEKVASPLESPTYSSPSDDKRRRLTRSIVGHNEVYADLHSWDEFSKSRSVVSDDPLDLDVRPAKSIADDNSKKRKLSERFVSSIFRTTQRALDLLSYVIFEPFESKNEEIVVK